jgi:hypothetical protein
MPLIATNNSARCVRWTAAPARSVGVLLVLAVLAAIAIGACSSGAPGSEISPIEAPSVTSFVSVPPSSSTTPPVTSPTSGLETTGSPIDDEIIRRYVAFWDARRAANTGTPNPGSPALSDLATGEELATVVRETQRNLEEGLTFQQREHPAGIRHVRIVQIDGDLAKVQECVVDDALLVRRGSGEVVDDTIATHNVLAELTRVGGQWQTSSVRLVQRWEGVAGCALAS